jgi:hypothetical protein
MMMNKVNNLLKKVNHHQKFIFGVLMISVIIFSLQITNHSSILTMKEEEDIIPLISDKEIINTYNQQFLEQITDDQVIDQNIIDYYKDLYARDQYPYSIPDNFDYTQLDEYKYFMDQISNFDSTEDDIKNYITRQCDPEETELIFSQSSENPSFEECLQETLFNNWFVNPELIEGKPVDQNQIVTYTQDDGYNETVVRSFNNGNEHITKTITTNNMELTEETIISGAPTITLIDTDVTEIDNIVVPIRQKSATTSDETIIVKKSEKISLEIGIPTIDKRLYYKIGIFEFRAWAHLEASVRLSFPVDLEIEYPKEVIAGLPYALKMKIIPKDAPNFREFRFKFHIDMGFSFKSISSRILLETNLF